MVHSGWLQGFLLDVNAAALFRMFEFPHCFIFGVKMAAILSDRILINLGLIGSPTVRIKRILLWSFPKETKVDVH